MFELKWVGVAIDTEATIVQLRPLYDAIMEQNARDANIDANTDAKFQMVPHT